MAINAKNNTDTDTPAERYKKIGKLKPPGLKKVFTAKEVPENLLNEMQMTRAQIKELHRAPETAAETGETDLTEEEIQMINLYGQQFNIEISMEQAREAKSWSKNLDLDLSITLPAVLSNIRPEDLQEGKKIAEEVTKRNPGITVEDIMYQILDGAAIEALKVNYGLQEQGEEQEKVVSRSFLSEIEWGGANMRMFDARKVAATSIEDNKQMVAKKSEYLGVIDEVLAIRDDILAKFDTPVEAFLKECEIEKESDPNTFNTIKERIMALAADAFLYLCAVNPENIVGKKVDKLLSAKVSGDIINNLYGIYMADGFNKDRKSLIELAKNDDADITTQTPGKAQIVSDRILAA